MSDVRNVQIIFDTNAEDVNNQIKNLNDSVDDVSDSTDNAIKTQDGFTKSLASNSNAVLENGGAMGLLNDLTGGYAMMVKDAVEASALFITKKKADTVATTVLTTATVTSNTATQQGIINKIKDTASTVASTIAKGVSTAATNVATAAQWLWNTAVLANPLLALIAGLVAAGAAIYTFTNYLIDSSKANEAASLTTAKHKKQLEEQSLAAARSTDKLKLHNDHLYDMAEAAGASSEELRKLRLKHIEEEIALNKSNATIASNTFIRERNTLATLKASGASDEVIEAQKKVTESSYKELQEQNKILDSSYKNRAATRQKNEVDIVKERTTARENADKEAKTASDKAMADAKKAEEDKNKAILEERKKYSDLTSGIGEGLDSSVTSIDDIVAKIKSDGEAVNQANKEVMEGDLENKVAIGENLVNEARNRQESINEVEAELEAKRLKAKEEMFDNIVAIAGAETAVGKAALVAKQILNAKELVMEISKTITFSTQAAARSVVAVAEGTAQTAKVGFPQNIPLLIGYAAQAAGIFAAIKSAVSAAKSSVSLPSISSNITATSQPNVSFVSSRENQLSTSISNSQSTQPIKTYVVSKDITTAQELDRNIISSTSL